MGVDAGAKFAILPANGWPLGLETQFIVNHWSEEMQHHDAPPPPRKTADRDAPAARAKRAWVKPGMRKMTYVGLTQGGPLPANNEQMKYRPGS